MQKNAAMLIQHHWAFVCVCYIFSFFRMNTASGTVAYIYQSGGNFAIILFVLAFFLAFLLLLFRNVGKWQFLIATTPHLLYSLAGLLWVINNPQAPFASFSSNAAIALTGLILAYLRFRGVYYDESNP